MFDSTLIPLLQCPRTNQGVRCVGNLVEQGGALRCERCSAEFRRGEFGVPMLREEIGAVAEKHYDGNYTVRSRSQDMAENAHAIGREVVGRILTQDGVQGPTLDVGCGTGIFAELLPGFVGLDYSLTGVTSAGTEPFNFVCGSAECLPFKAASFNCVFSIDALEHVPHPDLAFNEIDRVLKPGGHVVLKPAWHCTRYQTELLPIKKYGELSFRNKITKAFLPLLTSRPYKLAKFLPSRMWRRLFASRPTHLAYTPLTPNFSEWIADSDAAAALDCHEGILFFESRKYECLSHRKVGSRLFAGHDWIVLKKR